MSEQNLIKMVARERKKLEASRAALIARQAEFERDLATIDRELAAVNAYEKALGDGTATASTSTTGAAAAKPRKTRVVGKRKVATRKAGTGKRAPRRGSRREVILETLAASAEGMSRGEILVAMKAKGDKAAEQAISNALTAMKKAGAIVSKDGRYTAP